VPCYIKRKNKVTGPFTVGQIKSGIMTGKLQKSALISKSENGPWKTIEQSLSAKRKSAPLPSENVIELQELEVVADDPFQLLPLQENVLPSQAGSFDNLQKSNLVRPVLPKQTPSIQQRLQNTKRENTGGFTHFSSMEARFDNLEAATKRKSTKSDMRKKATPIQRLGILLSIGVLVVMLAGGVILFGPSISHNFELQKAKSLARQTFRCLKKVEKLQDSGIYDSPQSNRLMEQAEKLGYQIESLMSDWTKEQNADFEDWTKEQIADFEDWNLGEFGVPIF
jgi:hypothetical protein